MDESKQRNRKYESIAWGLFFIWFGIVNLFKEMPPGTSALGIAVILLGLNLARYLTHIPIGGFTTVLGVGALALGASEFLRVVLKWEIELPVIPLLLIAIGVIWLMRGVTRKGNE